MTSGSRSGLLVLGLGNLLLRDDGIGLHLLEQLAAEPVPGVEYIDGGSQGLALLELFEQRRAVLICDAVALGAAPGTVHTLRMDEIAKWRCACAGSAHESNAISILQALALLGQPLPEIRVAGIEPAALNTGMELSPEVEAALPLALRRAKEILAELSAHACPIPHSA